MPHFKKKAEELKEALTKNSYYGLCYLLCCVLLAVFIMALLIIPFASLPSSASKASNTSNTSETEENTTGSDMSRISASVSASADGASPSDDPVTEETVFPLDGRITSEYGWRESPTSTTSGYTFHYGIDISAAESDVILAYRRGTVKETGYSNSYGYYILISHNDHDSFYAHCDKVYASVGDTVECGEIIARAGETGRATGKHLHFEIRVNGTAIDPLDCVTPYEGQA